MYIEINCEIAARGARHSASRIDVLLLAFSDILRFMDTTIEDMIQEDDDSRGLLTTSREMHTLREFLNAEVQDIENLADRLEKQVELDNTIELNHELDRQRVPKTDEVIKHTEKSIASNPNRKHKNHVQ